MFTGENPFEGVEKFKLPQMPNKEYLTEDQITSLLDAAQKHAKERNVKVMEGQNLYLAIALMALAGLRKREACFAKWDWIDWEKRTIQVTNDATFVTKNKKPRTISMNKKLVEILAPHKKDAGYILENVRTNKGKSRYRVDFDRGFRRACEIAEIKATPHALRHSFASRHAVAGTSLHVIAGWLGHSTTWITERYTHFQTNFNDAADNI
jgi:integrase